MLFKVIYDHAEGDKGIHEIVADSLIQAEDFMVFTQNDEVVALVKTSRVLMVEVVPCRTLH